jgi:hypothetical protein
MPGCKNICCFDKAVDAYGIICTAVPALLSGTTALLINRVDTISSQIGTFCANATNTTLCMQIAQEIPSDYRLGVIFAAASAGLSLLGAVGWAAMRIEVFHKKPEEQELLSE